MGGPLWRPGSPGRGSRTGPPVSPPAAPDRLVDHQLVGPGHLVVLEPDAVHGMEAIGHLRDDREPGRKDDQVVGAGMLEIAQHAQLAVARNGMMAGVTRPITSTTSRRE